MRKVDIAYTAGIIDGEGCIHIRRQHDKRYGNCFKYTLSVSVTSAEEWLCKWLQFSWGGSVHNQDRRKEHPKWKLYWHWAIASRQANAMLKAIVPYLRIKRPQAEIAIGFQDRQIWGVNDTKETRALKEADHILLKALKR